MRQALGGSLLVGVLQQRIYLLVERRDLELVRAGSEDGVDAWWRLDMGLLQN